MNPPRTTSSSKLKATHRRPSTPAPALRSAPPALPAPVETAAQRAERLRAELQAAEAAARAEAAEERARVARAARNDEVLGMLKSAGLKLVDLDQFEVLQLAAAKRRIKEIEDDAGAPEGDYDSRGTGRKLKEIMALVDAMGVISKYDVQLHVKQDDGGEWKGNPVEVQLTKLVNRGELTYRVDRSPRVYGGKTYRKARKIYARTQEQLEAFQRKFDGVAKA